MSYTPGSFDFVRVLTTVDRAEIEDLLRRDEYFWLDLHPASQEDVNALGEIFGFHPLTIEDNLKFGQRPKLESYGSYAFVVFYGARLEDDRIALTELHMFLSGSYVVTIRQEPCAELDELRRSLEQPTKRSEQFVLYKIFDELTDTFFPVLSAVDEQIDTIESQIVLEPTDEQLQRIFRLEARRGCDATGRRAAARPLRPGHGRPHAATRARALQPRLLSRRL